MHRTSKIPKRQRQSVVEKSSQLNPEIFQLGANITSIARGAGGLAIGGYIAFHHPEAHSLVLSGEVASLAISDKVDGWLGKYAARLRGYKNKFGQRIDERMDKVAVHGVMAGAGIQAFANGQSILGTAFVASQAVIAGRDYIVNRERKIAAERGINVGARLYNRIKTALQFGVLMVAVSPINSPENVAPVAGAAIATAIGAVAGGAYFIHELQNTPTEIQALPVMNEYMPDVA